MKLLVAIPALDEEDSIRQTIEQCLAARAHITAHSPVTEVEITVVSDGSTDRTVEYARAYAGRIRLIVFPENRGYGAAIREAWRHSDADLLSFLDADGTCDPRRLADLCRELLAQDADVVLGNRLHRDSKMPPLRRLGNVLFAALLSAFSFARVRDVASGMRVVRRRSLPALFPLPATLDFTPAMSARALLSPDLKIVEVDMPYHERAGRSKLSPLLDGVRFLGSILRTVLLYRPARALGLVGALFLLVSALMMLQPSWFYLQHRRLEEWMIYRFLVAELLSTLAVLLLCTGHLASRAALIALSPEPTAGRGRGLAGRLLSSRWFWALPVAMVLAGVVFVWDAWLEYWRHGTVQEHWSRFVAMMVLLSMTTILVVTKVLDYCLDLLAERLRYLRSDAREWE